MKKLNMFLNDIYRHESSFKNIEEKLKGVVLDDDMFIDNLDVMNLIYYRFNGFIRQETKKEPTWKIDVIITSQENNEMTYDLKITNQKLLKERLCVILIKMSGIDEVMKKIN